MITWISKPLFAAICLIGLTGCVPGQVASLLPSGTQTDTVALSRVRMAGGEVLLAAPRGFCIDKASVKPRFALMARCDFLGAAHAAGAAPLGLIAVSVIPLARTATLPTPEQTARASGLTGVSEPVQGDDALIFRAEGPAPLEGLGQSHWRGTARVDGHVLGVALYGPEQGAATSTEGRDIVVDLINQTRAGS